MTSLGPPLLPGRWLLRVDEDEKQFILNMDKRQMENAPGFDKDNWPDTTAPEFATGIYSFYRVTPYWEE